MENIFVVMKEAIYSHGVHALSEDKDKAIDLCDDAKKQDRDDYHTWTVYKVPMNNLSSDPEGHTVICDKSNIVYQIKGLY